MVIASGASARSQQALGTVVMGGMIAVVILALRMVPVFFTVVQRTFSKKTEADIREAEADTAQSMDAAGALPKPAP
jgi:multidrug efflux pump